MALSIKNEAGDKRGKILFLTHNDIKTNTEVIKVLNAPTIISNMTHTANLITAIKDSLFVEIFSHDYKAKIYSKYRKIIEAKLESN